MAEAAFMTGLERNGDVVRMASYAPLLAHVDAWQWTPDAIWFDNLHSYGTPNYYVQEVFSTNTGTRIIPVLPQAQVGLFTSASLDERTHELIVKAVNVTGKTREAEVDLEGVRPPSRVTVIYLSSADPQAENSLVRPTNISPEHSTLEASSQMIPVSLRPYSVTVYRIPLK